MSCFSSSHCQLSIWCYYGYQLSSKIKILKTNHLKQSIQSSLKHPLTWITCTHKCNSKEMERGSDGGLQILFLIFHHCVSKSTSNIPHATLKDLSSYFFFSALFLTASVRGIPLWVDPIEYIKSSCFPFGLNLLGFNYSTIHQRSPRCGNANRCAGDVLTERECEKEKVKALGERKKARTRSKSDRTAIFANHSLVKVGDRTAIDVTGWWCLWAGKWSCNTKSEAHLCFKAPAGQNHLLLWSLTWWWRTNVAATLFQ